MKRLRRTNANFSYDQFTHYTLDSVYVTAALVVLKVPLFVTDPDDKIVVLGVSVFVKVSVIIAIGRHAAVAKSIIPVTSNIVRACEEMNIQSNLNNAMKQL